MRKAIVALAVTCVLAAPSRALAEPEFRYVALGDSAAAAPLVPPFDPEIGCLRSDDNYPANLARELRLTSYVDVSCSSAESADIVDRPQPLRVGSVPTQIDAVGPDTDLITISIGGNDVGLVRVALTCVSVSAATVPCESRYVADGRDSISDRIRAAVPAWDAMFGRLRHAAPNARIVLVGYGTYVRPGGCFPEQPMLPADADYLQAKVDELDDAERDVAARHGIEFFDTRPLTVGHDGCAAPGDRYLEGIVPSHAATPLHPNGPGSRAIAAALRDYLR